MCFLITRFADSLFASLSQCSVLFDFDKILISSVLVLYSSLYVGCLGSKSDNFNSVANVFAEIRLSKIIL